MNAKPLYVYGAAAHVWPVDNETPDLKPLLQQLWGQRFRRVNHYIELALVGAKSCLLNSTRPIASDCGVYLATEQGNVAEAAHDMASLLRDHDAVMPLSFLNAPNNMAGFYLAQALQLNSSNITVAHRAFPFESALDLARFDCALAGNSDSVLVGGVTPCALPLTEHRQRLSLGADVPLAEASSWLHCGSHPDGAMARIEDVCFFASIEALQNYLAMHAWPADTQLASGYGVTDDTMDDLARRLSLSERFQYKHEAPYHDTHGAYVLASFIQRRPAQRLLYINATPAQRYVMVSVVTLN